MRAVGFDDPNSDPFELLLHHGELGEWNQRAHLREVTEAGHNHGALLAHREERFGGDLARHHADRHGGHVAALAIGEAPGDPVGPRACCPRVGGAEQLGRLPL
ncbi:hypothetical protein [Pseudonocardia alaniniphila]|uniref:Uncharacterized protein n=1 Tax=Pseudonocardia alaniniphila TaxID=75291 RepID=A0ABS9TDD4_9PSEU|nr:hypothetical protein [Pseudonocardia alaniniphila]MCH6166408.1 hypothetical protein [Pseudonocardia alaniniphila]